MKKVNLEQIFASHAPQFFKTIFYEILIKRNKNEILFNDGNIIFCHSDYYSEWWIRRNRKTNYKGWHEPSLTKFFEIAGPYHNVLLDIGAHIGYFSALFSSIEGNMAIALEPFPENFQRLECVCNALRAQGAQILTHRVAISDKSGFSFMQGNANVPSTAHLAAETARSESSTEMVEVATLEQFVQRIDRSPDLIKIDVEGAEGQIIATSGTYLQKVKPTLIVEIHTNHLDSFNSLSYQEIVENLSSIGYHMYVFSDHRSAEPSKLSELSASHDRKNFDIVAVSGEKINLVKNYNRSL